MITCMGGMEAVLKFSVEVTRKGRGFRENLKNQARKCNFRSLRAN